MGLILWQCQRLSKPLYKLCSFHTLVRLCSKSFKLGFVGTGTESFQMYKLGLEKAEEPEVKLSTFTGPWRKQGNSRKKIYFCFMAIHILPFFKKNVLPF